ncbi:MAG: LppX_LprAFG lipoprotein [Actinomycetota bacterium]
MTTRRSLATPRRLAAFVAVAVVGAGGLAACSDDDGDSASEEITGPTLPDDVTQILDASATAMAEVESVSFDLVRSGAPVYLDQVESISVDSVVGQVVVDEAAAAVLGVQVDGALNTELGAIAVGDEVLLTNPITGLYEPLPTGIDIDPSLFFDPDDGWSPLLAGLTDATSLGIEQRRDADRYHVSGVAPAEQIEIITAGLVRNQDLPIDFWIHPATGLVTDAEFTAAFDGDDVSWTLELDEYGREFEIAVPDELRGDA